MSINFKNYNFFILYYEKWSFENQLLNYFLHFLILINVFKCLCSVTLYLHNSQQSNHETLL